MIVLSCGGDLLCYEQADRQAVVGEGFSCDCRSMNMRREIAGKWGSFHPWVR